MESESAAYSMGCSAIAVAAVPAQGMSFWTKRRGFEVVVPLKTEIRSSEGFQDAVSDETEYLGEPVNDLGDFLVRHMVLFTDTPLVAKDLSWKGYRRNNERCVSASNSAPAQQPANARTQKW